MGIIGILLAVIIYGRFFTPEDTWLCDKGGWIKHGNPSSEMPTTPCGDVVVPIQNQQIQITSLETNALVTSPLTISGKALGSWFFEASFPVNLFDSNNKLLGQGVAQAQGDWMTADFVPFTVSITFDQPETPSGYILFKNDNPSGDSAKSLTFKQIIKFGQNPEPTQDVSVFFTNKNTDPQMLDCSAVTKVSRKVPATSTIAKAAIEELIKGPTKAETAAGYFSSISKDTIVQKLTVVNSVAKVDFNSRLEDRVGGSCHSANIIAQITQTLKQFPTVKTVIISINGRSEDILQP